MSWQQTNIHEHMPFSPDVFLPKSEAPRTEPQYFDSQIFPQEPANKNNFILLLQHRKRYM